MNFVFWKIGFFEHLQPAGSLVQTSKIYSIATVNSSQGSAFG